MKITGVRSLVTEAVNSFREWHAVVLGCCLGIGIGVIALVSTAVWVVAHTLALIGLVVTPYPLVIADERWYVLAPYVAVTVVMVVLLA